jgi:antitoxin ParD1/3/4
MIKAYFAHVAYKYIFNHEFLCRRGRSEMKLITLYLPEPYIKALDQLVNEKFYPNRAEAIRVAIRDMINTEVWRRNTVG